MPSIIGIYRFDRNLAGVSATYQPAGPTVTADHAFFMSLGTNGRTCFTCHQPQDGWSLSAASAQKRFDASFGTEPLFRPFDGATCPTAAVATFQQKRVAYELLIEKGLIRIGLPLPPAAQLEFEVTRVDDPYHCTTNPATGLISPTEGIVSVYRRPLPATNLGFVPSLMWDGREPSLESQARNATLIHAQARRTPSAARQAQMVDFEKGLFTAQVFDTVGGILVDKQVSGGAATLAREQPGFYIGLNDPSKADFDPGIFRLYEAWQAAPGQSSRAQYRRSVARGEQIFNNGFCGPCHNTPTVGTLSIVQFQNIGISDATDPGVLDISGLPVFTLTCKKGLFAGLVFEVTDPGRALITGRCEDIGRFKVPGLRGLATRAPYFHNGSGKTLGDVVDFYAQRFDFRLTPEQKQDLVNFLTTL